jgi:lipoate-protein ligase A
MHGEFKIPGGKLVVVDLAVEHGRLEQVRVSGDFFLEPDEALDAINAALGGMHASAPAEAFEAAAAAGLAGARAFGISAEGVAIAVCRALQDAQTP